MKLPIISAPLAGKSNRAWWRLVLLSLLLVLVCADSAADDGAGAAQGWQGRPDLRVVVQGGWAWHFGKAEVDGVSGATKVLDDHTRQDHGVAAGLQLDLGLLALGPGDLGLSAGYVFSGPKMFHDLNLALRYRLHVDTPRAAIPGVEPFVALGAAVVWAHDSGDTPYVLAPAFTVGVDLLLPVENLFLGFECMINMINVSPVRVMEQVRGNATRVTYRLDDVFVLLRLGYKLF